MVLESAEVDRSALTVHTAEKTQQTHGWIASGLLEKDSERRGLHALAQGSYTKVPERLYQAPPCPTQRGP